MNPIAPSESEARRAEPSQVVVKVAGCVGCGGLPHGSTTAELACLRAVVVAQRERLRQLGASR